MATPQTFPVVGIGASAGGLEAMTALFEARPPLSGMALVIVQHLDPRGESHLVELLAGHTSLTIRPAQDGLEIQPDHVYVCVPNHDLVVRDGHLKLLEPEAERSRRHPIDRFFKSLATMYGDRAIAVILSGAASDGSRGIGAIKAAGGMVIAQKPETAEFDSMPRSAISTGWVDLVLPIQEMPEMLTRLTAGRPPSDPAAGDATNPAVESATLQSILRMLHERFDYDFTDYKQPTLIRRTHRRMSLRGVDRFDAYATMVREDANEAANLYRDLMINVSSFFRDPQAWQILERDVLVPLVASRESGDEIRIWSTGCATGEEAYTLGILLLECIERSGKRIKAQIFATDVSESLDTARAGIYPQMIASQLSVERLARFFIRQEAGWEVKKHLRDLIIFARHNVISDPPFSRMDLVCCRNVLIYIEPDMQRKILTMLNFALCDGGTLFLGSSETVGKQVDLFDPICEQWRIFRSRRGAHGSRFDFPRFSVADQRHGLRRLSKHSQPPRDEHLELAQQALLERYAPPSVVIDAKHQVLLYQGDTSPYLMQPGGEPTRDLFMMVAPGARPPLRQAIAQAISEKRTAVSAKGYINDRGTRRLVMLSVTPLASPRENALLLLVSFQEPEEPLSGLEQDSGDKNIRTDQTVDQLEEELKQTRRDLHDLSEQYDRLIEEYSTSNEEMLSINEELQSANEELETSKEELQSLNEELNTLNNELRSKVEAVEQTNNDLNNLLASTEIATLFMDVDCRVRWFTPAITQVLRLIATDIGRPIGDMASMVTGTQLEEEARQVLKDLTAVESEVSGTGNTCYIRRILPYRTSDNRIDGTVVTFVDITEHKRAERQRERLMHELSHRIKNTLATVHAIVQGLVGRSKSLPDFLLAFEPRLSALARAHTILTLPGDESIELQALLMREVNPYLGEDSHRVKFKGENLSLARERGIAIEMVFHELVTNATKYGALSNPVGSINVRWELISHEDGDQVCIDWVEVDGPRVASRGEPGFGTLLIKNSITHDLSGSVSMQFHPEGLHCRIKFPLEEAMTDAYDPQDKQRIFTGIE